VYSKTSTPISETNMQYALILAAALHVLTTAFWAGTTFALARTGGAAAERLFGPQLAAALLAFASGGYLGHTLHAHAFGRQEQVLTSRRGASPKGEVPLSARTMIFVTRSIR
jgi:hypothetical protein